MAWLCKSLVADLFWNKRVGRTFVPGLRKNQNQLSGIQLMSKDNKTSSVMRQIDENLRRVYFENQEDDVPDRFKQLLSKLKEQEQASKRDSDG